MDIVSYLASDNYIIVNKALIKTFGLNEAVMLGELCTEYRHWLKEDKLEDGMFYSTIDNIENNTGLTAHEQRQAIKSLENAGVLTTELKGVPAKKYFRIDTDSVVKILTTCSADFSQQDVKNLHSSNNKNNNKKSNNTLSKDKVENFLISEIVKPKKPSMWDKCVSKINDFTDDEILKEYLIQCLKLFTENSREAGKSFYTNHFIGKLNDLKSLSTDNHIQRKIALQTLNKGWNGFYELKEEKQYKKKDVFGEAGRVKSEAYTDDELAEMERIDKEREKKGMRTKF